jgi:hypothetical protein
LFYDESSGNFFWLTEKKGRVLDKPAGTVNSKGYRSINIDGVTYSYQRLAWYFMTDEWPAMNVGFKDNNPSNCRWDNLILVSNKERLHNYRTKNEELNPTPVVQTRVVKKATFSNKEVHDAVEEFIKDKTLVGGRYV